MITYLVDTNLILRFLLNDNLKQAQTTRLLISNAQEGKCIYYLSILLFVEAVFVLMRLYGFSKKETSDALLAIVDFPSIVIEKKNIVRTALEWLPLTSVSFIDLLLAAEAKETVKTLVTFDKKLKHFASARV